MVTDGTHSSPDSGEPLAADSLADSERFLQAILDGIQDGISVRDRDLTLLRVNRWMETMFADRMPLVGKKCYRALQQRETPCPWCPAIQAMETGEVHSRVVPYPSEEDARGRFEVTAFPLTDESGEVVGAIEHVKDVTDRWHAEQGLRASEETHRALVEASPDAVVAADLDFHLLAASDQAYAMFGYAKTDEVLGRSIAEFFRPEDVPRLKKNFEATLRRGLTRNIEYTLVRKDGSTFVGEVSAAAVRGGDGQVQSVIATVRDVTDRRRAEEALRRSEARYRAVVEAQTELVCRFRPDHTLTFVNEAYARYFGRPREELVGREYAPLIVEEERDRVRRALESISVENPVVTLEERVLRLDGGIRWQQWTNRGLFDADGCLVEYQAVGRDITARREAEEALRRSEEDYRLLFEQSVDGIVVVSDGQIVRANRAFAEIHGCAVEDLLGTPGTDLLHPDERAAAAHRIRGILDGTLQHPGSRQYHALRADGSAALVEYRSRRILWEGRPAVQAIVRDVTEQVRLQEQLQQAIKMEAVGQLAGGIAHDFNNLMTGILCHAGLLKTETGAGESVRETADLIEGAARRAAELTSQLLGFARRGKQQDVPVDLVATVETSVRLLSQSLTPTVTVETDFRTPRAYVRGDPVQMEQVVLNLAMNARDAMPDGGTVTFTIERREVDTEACEGHAHAQPGPYIVLTVADTGVGIPAEQHSRVFEPFFTTKPQGKGTGMGLAMVYGIVRNHGGWIDVESASGQGTMLRVFLPVAETPQESGPAPAPPRGTETATPTGRILIVDDEELVRDVVSRMLERLGYEVVAVASGQEAVAYYRDSGQEVAGVIIDFRMPTMNGRQCFRALKAIDPDLRAVLATGGGAEASMRDLLDEGLAALVKKPFEIGGLEAALRTALGR